MIDPVTLLVIAVIVLVISLLVALGYDLAKRPEREPAPVITTPDATRLRWFNNEQYEIIAYGETYATCRSVKDPSKVTHIKTRNLVELP